MDPSDKLNKMERRAALTRMALGAGAAATLGSLGTLAVVGEKSDPPAKPEREPSSGPLPIHEQFTVKVGDTDLQIQTFLKDGKLSNVKVFFEGKGEFTFTLLDMGGRISEEIGTPKTKKLEGGDNHFFDLPVNPSRALPAISLHVEIKDSTATPPTSSWKLIRLAKD